MNLLFILLLFPSASFAKEGYLELAGAVTAKVTLMALIFVVLPLFFIFIKNNSSRLWNGKDTYSVSKPVISTNSSQPNHELHSDDFYFSVALKEIEANRVSEGLWAKALAYGDGNNEKVKAFYIRPESVTLNIVGPFFAKSFRNWTVFKRASVATEFNV